MLLCLSRQVIFGYIYYVIRRALHFELKCEEQECFIVTSSSPGHRVFNACQHHLACEFAPYHNTQQESTIQINLITDLTYKQEIFGNNFLLLPVLSVTLLSSTNWQTPHSQICINTFSLKDSDSRSHIKCFIFRSNLFNTWTNSHLIFLVHLTSLERNNRPLANLHFWTYMAMF